MKLKMLRDATDYKSNKPLLVDEVYELDRTEAEVIRGIADGLWVEADEQKTEDSE